MSRQVEWNKHILERFAELAMLNDEEYRIMETRIKGWTITRQSMEFGISTSAINRMIKRLKEKYDNVQKLDPTLPVRRYSAKEDYMDTH